MFKFVTTIILLLHLCNVLTYAAPNPTQALHSIRKKSVHKAKGPRSGANEAICEEMKKKLMEEKKNKKKHTKEGNVVDDTSRLTVVPEVSHQFQWVAVAVCSLKRAQCTALYETCIQSGIGCNSCWDNCQDLRECAIALGRNYVDWALEGEGNRFECQQECGCMFDMDL